MKKFDNYVSNLNVLRRANKEDLENEFIVGGIIDKFFIQFELAWKVLKELMEYEGAIPTKIASPRTIIKEAYSVYDFMNEDIWLAMLKDRNNLAHIYDGEAAKRLVENIINIYIKEFDNLKINIEENYDPQIFD